MALESALLNIAGGVPRHRKKFLFALLGGLLAAYYFNRKNKKLQKECKETRPNSTNSNTTNNAANGNNVGVNLAFIQQLKKIIPICIPGKKKKSC